MSCLILKCHVEVGCNQHFMLILNVFFRCQPNIDPECILALHGGLNKVKYQKKILLLSSNISLSFCVCGERKKRLDKIKPERKKYLRNLIWPIFPKLYPPCRPFPKPMLNPSPLYITPLLFWKCSWYVLCGRSLNKWRVTRWFSFPHKKLNPVGRVCWVGLYFMFLFQVATKREFQRRNAVFSLPRSLSPLPSLIH